MKRSLELRHTSGPMPAPSRWLRTSAVDTSKVSGRGPLPLVASGVIASRCASVPLSARVASRGACTRASLSALTQRGEAG